MYAVDFVNSLSSVFVHVHVHEDITYNCVDRPSAIMHNIYLTRDLEREGEGRPEEARGRRRGIEGDYTPGGRILYVAE